MKSKLSYIKNIILIDSMQYYEVRTIFKLGCKSFFIFSYFFIEVCVFLTETP